MKKLIKFLGIAAVAAVIVFSMTACDGDPGDDPGGKNPGGNNTGGGNDTEHLIAGKFAGQAGNGDAVFYANIDTSASASVNARQTRNVIDTDVEPLTGKIEDGEIIFNLKGTILSSGEFVLSAGSSILVYQIEGSVQDDGTLEQTEAIVKVKTGESWETIHIPVTAVANADDLDIEGDASDDQVEGIPEKWLGRWITDWSYDDEDDGYIELLFPTIITPFAITIIGENSLVLNLFEVENIDSTTVECIIEGIFGGTACSDCNDDGSCPSDCVCITYDGVCECGDEESYMKITLKEELDGSLQLIVYMGSYFPKDEANALESVRAFDTDTADPEDLNEFVVLTR